jgi:hypothetical protein
MLRIERDQEELQLCKARGVAEDGDVGLFDRLNEMDHQPEGLGRTDDPTHLFSVIRTGISQKLRSLDADDGREALGPIVGKRLIVGGVWLHPPLSHEDREPLKCVVSSSRAMSRVGAQPDHVFNRVKPRRTAMVIPMSQDPDAVVASGGTHGVSPKH